MLRCLSWMPNHWKFLVFSMGLLLGAAAYPAAGQAALVAADTAATSAARPDTAVVLRRLFAAQRRGNQARLLAAGASVLLFNYFLAYSKQETTWQRISTGLVAGVLGQGVYNLGEAVVRGRRYRPAREKAVLAALAQGRPMPRRIRKKLVAEYLKPKPTAP